MTFHLTRVHTILVRFGLLSGHFLGIAAHSVDHKFTLYFDYLLFPILVLRAGFWVLIDSVPDLCIRFTSIADPLTSKLDMTCTSCL